MVLHLNIDVLDHAFICIHLDGVEDRKNRPFRFLSAWAMDNRSNKVVKDA